MSARTIMLHGDAEGRWSGSNHQRIQCFRALAGPVMAAVVTLPACGLSGCTRPERVFFRESEHRVVWPPPPERPRVEYLGEFAGSLHPTADRTMSSAWHEFLHGPENPPALVTPHAVAASADGKRLAVADPNAVRVHLLDIERETYRAIRGSFKAEILLKSPVGVAWAGDELYIIDSELHALVRVEGLRSLATPDDDGDIESATTFGHDMLRRPAGIAYNAANDRLYVTDSALHKVLVFDRGGGAVAAFGDRGGGTGQFNYPSQVAAAPDGSVVVADSMNFRIQRFSPDGDPIGEFGRKGDAPGDFALPKGVAVGSDGSIWVVDAQFENVQAFTADGRLLLTLGREGHGPGEFWLPAGAAIDSRSRLWIADSYNRRVQGFQLLP